MGWGLKHLGKPHISQFKTKVVLLMKKKLKGYHPTSQRCQETDPKARSIPEEDIKAFAKKNPNNFWLNLIHNEVTAKREHYGSLVQNVLFFGFISTNEEQVRGTKGNAVHCSSPAHAPAPVVPQHLVFCSFPARGCTLYLPNNTQINHYLQS